MKKEAGRRSLAAKTVRSTVLSCLLFGAIVLLVGLGFYTFTVSKQYIKHAFETASHASVSVSHGIDSRGLADNVMRIYRGLSEEQRQTVGTEEYRALFSEVDTGEGSAYDTLIHILTNFLDDGDEIFDVYIAMYDPETSAMVYIVDPETEDRLYPGEWETVSRRGMERFLNWDGAGMLYELDNTQQYGWLCTAGVPVRNRTDDAICLFVLADVSLDNVINGVKGYAIQVTLGILAASLLISWILTKRIQKRIVKPINAIADAAATYARDKLEGAETGDHFSALEIHTQDEVENLSHIMADMEQDLTKHEEELTRIAAEKERIGTELNMAARIQYAMMPHTFPPFPDRHEFDLYASMDPAREVGGDFYDFFLVDEDHLCVVMADVSGKGVPAALFMMISKVILQSCAMLGSSAGEILTKTNEAICSNNQVNMFITVWVGILEISTGRLTAANAGHEYPVLKRADGDYELLKDKHGFVVGGLAGTQYREYELQLNPGDRLFLYTDGVPEATDAEQRLFGTDRMLAALNEAKDASPEQVLAHMRGAVDEFVQQAEQFDDLTMLCLEYKGK